MVEVTQADREAAAEFWQTFVARPGECIVRNQIRKGNLDEMESVQSFARHRAAAVAEATAPLEAEIARLREALRAYDDAVLDSRDGWENVVELGLLPPQHRDTARKLQEQCWKAAYTARAALGGESHD